MKNNVRKMRIDSSALKSFEESKVASPWLRILAQVIDQGLVSFAVISAMSIWFPQKIGTARWLVTLLLLWVLVSTITQTLFIWFYKNSPGKKSLGLTLQSAQPGTHHIRFTQIVVRSFTWWLGAFTFGAGWSTILSRPDRRAWHDVASDTIVLAKSIGPQYPTVLQKRIGELWLGILSVSFAFFIVTLLMVQMQTLHRESSSTDYRRFEQLSLLDQQSWLVVAGAVLTPPDGILIGDESKLSHLLLIFSQGRKLPLGDRYAFYKANMEPIEDQICRPGREKLPPCQSARLMVELLTPSPEKTGYPKALQGLIALQNIETLPTMTEQITFIENEIRRSPVYSPQYFAFKSAEAKIYLKAGDFKRAKETVEMDAKKIPNTQLKGEKVFENAFVGSACEIMALQDCNLEKSALCMENPLWKDWSAGCVLKDRANFSSKSMALGFWWAQAQTQGIKNFKYSDWEESRNQTGENKNEFQNAVDLALDFVINIKTQPKNVLAKERKLAPENPLWGWAQKQALQELGNQWSYIIYPLERRILEKFNILGIKQGRTPASETMAIERKPRLTPQLTIER